MNCTHKMITGLASAIFNVDKCKVIYFLKIKWESQLLYIDGSKLDKVTEEKI